MSPEFLACITILALIGILLLWRIPFAIKIKKEEQQFIACNKEDYAILIFYGDELEFKELDLENTAKIKSYYATTTYAIPDGKYYSKAIFPYKFSNPNNPSTSVASGLRYTGAIYQELVLKKGNVYRYRIKDEAIIDKKQLYKTIQEKIIASKPIANIRLEHAIVFEQIL